MWDTLNHPELEVDDTAIAEAPFNDIWTVPGEKAPAVPLTDGRRAVELFTAIYRSNRDHELIRFPLVKGDGSV